jgi:hypothetical protein
MGVLVAAGFLAACAWDPPTIQRVPRETAAVDAKAKAGPAKKSAAKSNAIDDIGEEEAAPPEQEAALPVDLTNFKERLVGLEADEITDLMGTPDLERSEPPALIWQFRRPICSVDVFMFDDGNGQAVDHVEVRGAKDDTVDEKECFASVLKNTSEAKGAAANQAKTAATTPLANGGNGSSAPKPASASPASTARATSAAKAAASAGKASGPQKFAPKKPSAVLDDPTADDEPPPPAAAPPSAAKASAPAGSASKAAAAAATAKGQAKAKASTAPPPPDGDLPPDLSE